MRDLLQLGVGNALTSAMLAVVVLAVTRFWRRPQAAWWLWALVLAKLAAPPLCALPVRVDGWLTSNGGQTNTSAVVASSQSLSQVYAAASSNEWARGASTVEPSALSRGMEVAAAPLPSNQGAAESRLAEILELLALMIWLAGSLVLIGIIAARVIRFHRLVLHTPLANEALQRVAARCAQRLNLRRTPEVHVTHGCVAPLVWAVGRRARVLLPAALLERLSDEQTTTLLTHELAHLRRRDPWMRWFETLVVVLYWWNPVAWWARARLQRAEEECCDAAVLRVLPDHAKAYAQTLLETVNFLSEGRTAAPLLASGFGRVNLLKRRFEMILQGSRRRLSWKGRLALLLASAALIPFSAYAVWGEEDADLSSMRVVQRLERLERLLEKLLARDEVVASTMGKADFVNSYRSPREKQAQIDNNSASVNETDPPQVGDPKDRNEVVRARRQWFKALDRRVHPTEEKIQDALQEPVVVNFENQPLAEVLDTLSAAAGVNFHLNQEGLNAEGVTSDAPITIQLREPVSLRSALNLILEPLHLSYAIRNEVLEITSAKVCPTMVQKVYNVGDLVIPIPALLHGAPADLTAWVLGTQQTSPANLHAAADKRQPPEAGADYDSLIATITSTIAPESWEEAGGPGAIHPGTRGNLSLIISQTPEVHEQIADLLEQMRRLLDVRIVIESRFLSVPQDFFERVGADFDLATREIRPVHHTSVGEDGLERIGVDFETIERAPSPIENFAKTHCALLTDGQTRALVVAAQDHPAASILAAPKVTTFNGQRALISIAQVVPPRDDGKLWSRVFKSRKGPAEQENVSLGLQGVVSNDRRSIRLSVATVVSKSRITPPPPAAEPKVLPNPQAAPPADAGSASDPATASNTAPHGRTSTVTMNLPDGHTMLMDGGNLSGTTLVGKSDNQRLLLLVTPRIVIAEEEEELLGIKTSR